MLSTVPVLTPRCLSPDARTATLRYLLRQAEKDYCI